MYVASINFRVSLFESVNGRLYQKLDFVKCSRLSENAYLENESRSVYKSSSGRLLKQHRNKRCQRKPHGVQPTDAGIGSRGVGRAKEQRGSFCVAMATVSEP